MVEQGRFEDEF